MNESNLDSSENIIICYHCLKTHLLWCSVQLSLAWICCGFKFSCLFRSSHTAFHELIAFEILPNFAIILTRACRRWILCKIGTQLIGTRIKPVRVNAYDRVRRDTHAITSAGDAVQTPNKHAWNVLPPRLPAELLRVIASDHVLSTTLARVIEFDPRLNCIRTTCNTRGYTRTKFWSAQNVFPRPHRG